MQQGLWKGEVYFHLLWYTPQKTGSCGAASVQAPGAAVGPQASEAPLAIWDSEPKPGGLSMQVMDLLTSAGLDVRKEVLAKAPAQGLYQVKTMRKNLPAGIFSISIKGGTLDCVQVFSAVQQAHAPASPQEVLLP
jgi:hypothetical protein